MSKESTQHANAAPLFDVFCWDDPLDSAVPARSVTSAAVIGVGESAHFVAEFTDARVRIVEHLVTSQNVTAIALEVGHDEAPVIQEWIAGGKDSRLTDLVGPLTFALYGSFLTELRHRLPKNHQQRIIGVDLPNSLTLEPTLAPLAALIAELDPGANEVITTARRLASGMSGGSAAASAASWMGLEQSTQDALTVALARIQGRLEAVGSAHDRASNADVWRKARQLATTAVTTDLMLSAMADLFSGTGLIDDTTIRERFVASRILEAVNALDDGERIAYVAHNNHIQKTPVMFDGVLTAFPAGSFLATVLGERYVSLALTHRDETVPEMAYPATTEVGFRVERVAAPPIDEKSVEGAVPGDWSSGSPVIVRPARTTDRDVSVTIRSQSAVTEIPVTALDASIVFATAHTDSALSELGLLAHDHAQQG